MKPKWSENSLPTRMVLYALSSFSCAFIRRTIWTLTVSLVPLLAFSALSDGIAQQPCPQGFSVEGIVTDPSGAVIADAKVEIAGSSQATTDPAGQFTLSCLSGNQVAITVQADGFADASVTAAPSPNLVTHLNIQLQIANLATNIQVGDDVTALDADHGVGTRTLSTRDVQQLSDDPDDFLRELQAIAASGGGMPGSALLTVDGFENASAVPPKGSIASIRVNPDLFSAEYESAPYLGGRIEIFTKPGASPYHGALFFTDSNAIFNATDPLSATATPAGKQRYGFEISGPVVAEKNGFALALEKRDIDEFNVVDAVTLDAEGNPSPLQQSVSAPQRLWIASARDDWQAAVNDSMAVSFTANVNNLGNQGIGGLTLAEAGYSSLVSEYDLRLNNTLTLGTNILHETRIGYTWKRTANTPVSMNPSLQVAGYFTGGGATSQNLDNREQDLEADDDLMVTQGKHTWKIGAQSLGFFVHDYDPNTFNGAFQFGGGSAPVLDANNNPTGQTTTISGIEQYRRALLSLPGGSPTTYQLTTGTALVPLTQWRLGLYAQDAIKLAPQFSVIGGLRYQLQTSPNSFSNFSPRVGLSWSPDKKSTWIIHLRAGIFHFPNQQSFATEVARLNGVRQQETTVYSPSYNNPLTPVSGSIHVSAVDQFPRSLIQISSFQTHVGIERTFPGGWHLETTLYWYSSWNQLLSRNINAPLILGTCIGIPPDPIAALMSPRPGAPNENVIQYQNAGHSSGNVFVIAADRPTGKWASISGAYVHVNGKSNTSDASGPQSSYSNIGENSRDNWVGNNAVYANGSLHLPRKLDFSSILDVRNGTPYNITTGTDANGDGNFNDRPSYASAPGSGAYSTPFGLLTTNTVNGNVPRNLGTMPTVMHLDASLSRAFTLNPKDKTRTLIFSARSANLLNHTNITAVNTVLSSSAIGQSLAAETARRIELGVRFAF
ncbi:TonB-dependent receptor [Acidicapsa ligni]|uniref:TonB-dependent receptor n=1 Tax=Acidicapsa ligni TaxID=542300 RepID=UPI0021DFC70B|nr:TonB-dependent receptor [Acidicapsa ligni]